MAMKNLLTIVPPEAKPGKPMVTFGTKVLLPDGQALSGVTRIELVAELNDLWRARIDCHVNVPTMKGVRLDGLNGYKPLTWWRRALLRIAGVKAFNSTSLGDKEYRYERV